MEAEYTNENWPMPDHPIARICGAHIRSFPFDAAHSLCKQGVTNHFMAAVFHEVVYEYVLVPNGTLGEQEQAVWAKMLRFYKLRRCQERIAIFSRKSFTDPDKPHQNFPMFYPGNMTKVRVLVRFMAELCKECNRGSLRDQHRVAAAECLCDIYDFIYRSSDHPMQCAWEHMQEVTEAFLAHYAWLSNHAVEQEKLLYHGAYKFHELFHIAEDAKYLSPRISLTLTGEDFMGKISTMAGSCAKGVGVTDMAQAVMQKYIRMLAVRWIDA